MAQAVLPPGLISLLSRWGAGPDAVTDAAADVLARYQERHRRYHTLEHINEMLDVTGRLEATDEVTCAVWMHDAIYDPRTSDNEARSACLARELLERLGAPAVFVNEVVRLVESTAHHDPADGDRNGAILADADLAILGAPADRYRRYARDVRAEYAHVSDDDWRAGRAAVIRTFLDRPVLFHSRQMRDACEHQARENLRAELVALAAP